MNTAAGSLSSIEAKTFQRDGYVVLRRLVPADQVASMRQEAERHLAERIAPIEYEVDVQYPGAPEPQGAGADACRRLLQVYARGDAFRTWATSARLRDLLQSLYGGQRAPVAMSQCHHNCVMTKSPGYSSVTLWHQDIRYWAFDRQELISLWLALGKEHRDNGCLRVIPGSHRLALEPGRFDASLFLRPDLPENKALLKQARPVELAPGDLLAFHCRLFHAAGRNLSDQVKYSLVFTYHEADNHPIAGTRSARFPSIPL